MPLTPEQHEKIKSLVEDISDLSARFQFATLGMTWGLRDIALKELDKWADQMHEMIREYKEIRQREVVA